MSHIQRAALFGSISTGIVSLLSLAGALIVPLLRGSAKNRWMHFFISMAVATLSSDALLHIVPQILGLHNHSETDNHHHEHDHHHEHHEDHENSTIPHENDHDHDDNQHMHHNHNTDLWTITTDRSMLLYLSTIMIAIYLLYLFEFIIYNRKKTHKCQIVNEHSMAGKEMLDESQCSLDNSKTIASNENHDAEMDEDTAYCCGLKSRAVVILLGDGIHNLVDGVAIGASYLASTQLGIITTVAVICHELPHELGDLAVLLDSGLSMWKALALNLLSALTAFIGLFISIALGYNSTAERILLAFTAGMFLYVAWIDMLAHLRHIGVHKDHWLITCALQSLGFFFGFFMVFSLGWLEHDLFH